MKEKKGKKEEVWTSSSLLIIREEGFANEEKRKKKRNKEERKTKKKEKENWTFVLAYAELRNISTYEGREVPLMKRKIRSSKWAAETLRAGPLDVGCFDSGLCIVEREFDVWLSQGSILLFG